MMKSKFSPQKQLRITDNSDVKLLRDQNEIMRRIIPLSFVCVLTETGVDTKCADAKMIVKIIKKMKLKKLLTPKEYNFVFNKKKTMQEAKDLNWHYERLGVLLWTLGFDVLIDFNNIISVPECIRITQNPQLLAKAKLRSLDELIEYEREANEAYWICVDSKINGKKIEDYTKVMINSEVAMERLIAIRWIVGSEKEDWDNVAPHTYCPYAIKK